MRRALHIQNELGQIHIVEDLTEVFESVASMHIAKIRNRVIASKSFFAELWPTYRSLRLDPEERVVTSHSQKGRNAFVALTAEGRLGGQVNDQIIDQLLQTLPNSQKTDVMSIGGRGAELLAQHQTPVVHSFPLPSTDINFSVGDIIKILQEYDHITVFYQTYESLRTQKVVRIELLTAVRVLGDDVGEEGETVSSRDYIFEPNIGEIAKYMESVMMGVALTQIIMESKLAGYAARFNAMNAAKRRARDLVFDIRSQYYRAKRAENDERLKEIMKITKIQRAKGGIA